MHGAEFTVVLIAAVTLAAGAALRLLSKWTRFPYTIAMLLLGIGTGLVLARIPGASEGHGVLALLGHGAHISSDLIIFVFLPALVFESAYSIEVVDFRKNVGAVAVLAVPALVLATVLTGGAMIGLTGANWHWGWPAALVFGALISATDPVAVVAIFRELGVSKRLAVLIEGESLLNDGTAIVVFTLLVQLLTGEVAELDAVGALARFAWVVSGGLLVGLGLSWLLSSWIGRLFNDPLAEITLTLVLAYGAMIIAEGLLHVSGVMAVVVSGLWMSSKGKTKISPEVSHFLHRFWEMLGYFANTLIFFLVGLVIAAELDETSPRDLAVILGAYAVIMLIRAALTFGFQPITNRLSDGVSSKDSAVIAWGGLRGAVSLALALIVARHPKVDPDTGRQILLVTGGVVLLTILVNGTTVGRLLAAFGYDQPPLAEQLARLNARADVLGKVLRAIGELSRSRELRAVGWDEVEQRLDARRRELDDEVTKKTAELEQAPEAQRLNSYWRRALALERRAYWTAYARGTVSARAIALLSKELDAHLERIARGDFSVPPCRVTTGGITLEGKLRGLLGGRGAMGFDSISLLYDLSRAEASAAASALSALESLGEIPPEVSRAIRDMYGGFRKVAVERLEDIRTNLPEMARAIETRLAERIELNLEREGIEELVEHGVLSEGAAEGLLHTVEERMAKLWFGAERVPIPETAEIVASMPMFEHLSAEALADLAELTEERVLPAGETIFEENDAGDSMFVIARGAVHVLKVIDGEEQLLDVLGGGDILGEMALLTGEPRTASARTATAVTLGCIPRDGFEHLMRTQPRLSGDVWANFCRRSFDNHLLGDDEWSYLDHDARVEWFDAGHVHAVDDGERIDVPDGCIWAYAALGAIEVAGTRHPAPALVRLGSDGALIARGTCKCVVLPDPSEAIRRSRAAAAAPEARSPDARDL